MRWILRYVPYTLAIAAAIGLVEFFWQIHGSFFGLAFASLVGIALVAWASPVPDPVAGTADRTPCAPLSDPLPVSMLGHALALAGALFLGLAWWLALNDHQLGTLLAIVAAAFCWRPILPMRPETSLSRRSLGISMGMVMLVATAFRFYRVGDLPAGMITVDEPRLMGLATQFMNGMRATFWETGAEGYAPVWVEAAAMWLFGHDITGFRMSAAIPGLMLVGVIGLLGLELLGSRMALMAAAFTAVAVWPVTFSRQEYFQGSSFMPMLGALLFFLRGLRRSSRVELALAGFWLGLCFNVYSPSRLIPVLLVLLAVLLWLRRPGWRSALLSAWQPLLGGLLVGLAPLLLWAAHDPHVALRAYFGKLDWGFIGGAEVQQARGLLSKFDIAFRNILPGLPRLLTMFTTHGGMRPWFFILDQPVIDQATLFLLLCGFAVSLVRFRQPAYPFLVAWWLLGLTPTLLAQPQYHMDERRIMLNMPATLLLAAVGLHGLLSLALRGRKQASADKALAAAALAFFAVLGVNSWRTYFHDMEVDLGRRAHSHANFDNGLRSIFRAQAKGPVYAISTRKGVEDAWQLPSVLNELEEHLAILHPIPYKVAAFDAAYFMDRGLLGLLRQQPPATEKAPAPDPVILLTPFHFYLEPFLVKELGGEMVEEIPVVQTPKGPDYTDVGMARDPKVATRLVRLKGFSPSKLDSLERRWLLPFHLQELTPPAALGNREKVQKAFVHDPEGVAFMEAYTKEPGRWKGGPIETYHAEPWWWVTTWFLPKVRAPYRLSAVWGLQIPADGTYSFGLATTLLSTVKIDGKKVVDFMPRTREGYPQAREGVWGQPVELKGGMHRFELDAVMLNDSGYISHVQRVLWQKPGGEKETLPWEQLFPTPPR